MTVSEGLVRPVKNENSYDDLFRVYGQKHQIDWRLLKAQVRQESLFNPEAVSPAGARGLAQFMPATWNEWGRGDIFNAEMSIQAQARYLAWLLIQFKYEKTLALAAYNWGIGNVKKLIKRERSSAWEYLKLLMPKETSTYVQNILLFYKHYRELK